MGVAGGVTELLELANNIVADETRFPPALPADVAYRLRCAAEVSEGPQRARLRAVCAQVEAQLR